MLIFLSILFSISPLLFYLTIALCSSRFLSDDGRDRRNRPICTSPGCVRCNRNSQELASALERFRNARYDMRPDCARIRDALTADDADSSESFFRMSFPDAQRPIWPRAVLPNSFIAKLELLEQHHVAITEECDRALDYAYLWRRNDELDSGSSWFTFSLINQGAWQDQQCRECPRLTALLHKLDDSSDGSLLTDCFFGNVFVSMLPANSAIAEHRGLTNTRLRVHFGVQVPSGDQESAEKCYMVVGGEKFHWSAGSAVVIDDSFPHSVSSKGCPKDRVVLLLDFWYPNLSSSERECLQRIFPPIYA